MPRGEHDFFRKNVQQYYNYMRSNDNSLLIKVAGIYHCDGSYVIIMEVCNFLTVERIRYGFAREAEICVET